MVSKTPELVRGHELFRWGYTEGLQLGVAFGLVAGVVLTLVFAALVLWGHG